MTALIDGINSWSFSEGLNQSHMVMIYSQTVVATKMDVLRRTRV